MNTSDKIKYLDDGYVVICSWCENSRRLTEVLTKLRYKISHSICKDCAKKQMEDIKNFKLT